MQYSRLVSIFFNILVILTFNPTIDAQRARGRPRLCSTVTIPNAVVRPRANYKFMRIICAQGFTIKGSNIVACENGKWNAAIPVCAKEGCEKPDSPPNGLVLPARLTAHLYCKEGYKLAGGRVTYCNGTNWDRPLGECRETSDALQLACDFETDDLCGWSHDETHRFDWKRVMAANMFQTLRTGPQHDHTTFTNNSGHFMLMESFDQRPDSVARLLSPIYPKKLTQNSGCFKFWYFMFGATVGSLNVYVRPVSVDIDEMLQEPKYQYFTLSGNQKSAWKEATFIIKPMSEDFQIVVEGTAGSNHLSDIAIDDLQLMTYSECNEEATTLLPPSDYTEYAIYDVQSCEGRCSEVNSTGSRLKSVDGKILKMCDCHSECEAIDTCCPNYRTVCDFGDTDGSTELVSTATAVQPYENLIESTTTTVLTTKSTTFVPPNTTQVVSSSETTRRTSTNTEQPTTATITTTTRKSTSVTPKTTQPTTERTTIVTKQTTQTTSNVPQTFMTIPASAGTERPTEETLSTLYTTSRVVQQDQASETNHLQRKEEAVFWEVDHSSQMQNTYSVWDVLGITFAALTIVLVIGFLLKHRGRLGSIFPYPYHGSGEDDNDTTTLTYNQADDTIIEN